jgi:hydroxymethylpyrimidine pyrophosphatase-like HAD family hydrolase
VRSHVRLVATDLDGTLLRPDGSVSARTRAAVAAVQERGVRVVLAGPRPGEQAVHEDRDTLKS